MPSYPADSVVHRINEHACGATTCPNTKLGGASMRLCAQCKSIHYCSTECQRADWARHKALCKSQAAECARLQTDPAAARLVEDFKAWHAAMGPIPFTWICVHGLAVYRHPENIQTKFVVLVLRVRKERPSKASKMFEYDNIFVLDRSELPRVMGGEGEATAMTNSIQDKDKKAKANGKAGAALLITIINPVDDHETKITLFTDVILRMAELDQPETIGWKNGIKDIINEGRSIKREVAAKEKAGELLYS
ncbi:hypothetical protein FB451DRAFT_1270528 [Mycena latifolia]|nr:hypothetical protein FB451DRAFT_1270528 [Mycena latifolia]